MSTEITTQTETSTQTAEHRHRVTPRWHSKRNDEAYQVEIELPGVAKDQVRLHQEQSILILEADRELPSENQQILAGSAAPEGYKLRLKLPAEINSEKLHASLNKGVLSLVLPLRSENLPREIPLN